MEIIRGKQTSFMDKLWLTEMIEGYQTVHLDIGTGDGRFVQNVAMANSKTFVIGVDACRENLTKVSRSAPKNALFVIANAEVLPSVLEHSATHMTINFPWGSLLQGLLEEDSSVMSSLLLALCPNGILNIHLNGGALAEQGYSLEAGTMRVKQMLRQNGFDLQSCATLEAADLKAFPTTWAKRLAYGRDPRATHLLAKRFAKTEYRVSDP